MRVMLSLLGCLAIAGCSVALRADGAASSGGAARVSIDSRDPLFASMVAGVLLVQGTRELLRGADDRLAPLGAAPEPDPRRSIHAQDCTMPVDFEHGNLICR